MKYQKSNLLILIFLFSITVSWAQVDYKSVENDSIAPDGYLYHKLLANDNFKSLSKLYNISKSKIKRLNPLIRRGFKTGMLIKLPANDDLISLINKYRASKIKNKYIVQHQDTKFGIAKRYNISIDELERLNPKIRQGLIEGDTLFVPKIDIQKLVNDETDFLLYRIKKSDTFYSLNKLFNVTKEKLIFLNPDLSLGLKEGMYIKIPKPSKTVMHLTKFKDSIKNNMALNVLFLLPFKSNLDSVSFDNKTTESKLRNIVTDLYFGAEIALDSIANQGVKINAQVYDTENDLNKLKLLFLTHNFDKTDLVVGPLFTKNISFTNRKLSRNKAYVLAPFSTSAKASLNSKSKIVQETPLQTELTKKVIDYVVEHYSGENLILVTDTLPQTKARYNLILQKLALKDSVDLNEIKVVTPANGYIKKELLLDKIDTITTGKNWVVDLSMSSVLLADVINNLGVLPKASYDITMYSISQGKLFKNIDNNFLARLNFCYPSSIYTDDNIPIIKIFDKKYISNYHSLPTEYSYKGFDMVYDALARLARRKKLLNKKSFGVSRRTSYLFDYTDDIKTNKILNKGVFLLKYQGLSIKLVE